MNSPPKRITDRDFHYTPSHATDVGKTFARIIAERKRLAAQLRQEADKREGAIPIEEGRKARRGK